MSRKLSDANLKVSYTPYLSLIRCSALALTTMAPSTSYVTHTITKTKTITRVELCAINTTHAPVTQLSNGCVEKVTLLFLMSSFVNRL